MDPRLVVVIDTEEDWFDDHARPVSVDNIRALPGVHQRIFDPLGVRPVYLVNYPVAHDPEASGILRELAASGVCEIGAHVHNWTSPPFTDEDVRLRTYHTAIDRDLERRKIADVKALIEQNIGVTPTAFKGGRWGVDARTFRSLAELGFQVDTSVCPLTDYGGEGGGPNFFDAPFRPYFPAEDDVLKARTPADPANTLMELPVSIGFTSGDFEHRRRLLAGLLASPLARRLRSIGILHRLGVLRRVKFSQETATFAEMKQLIDAYLARAIPQLHMTFHSNVLAAGCSPYSSTRRDLDERNEHLRNALTYARERGAAPATVAEFRTAWLADGAA